MPFMCYQKQFPDSVIAKSVAIGPNEMSYVVAYGLRPYFTDMTIRELMIWQSYFKLHFDKTVIAQVKSRWMCLFDSGQRDTQWSQSEVMLGHVRAEDVVKEMLGVLDKLAIPLRPVLSLGMDGPNVNKSIMYKINQVKKEKGYQPLVKCPPSCPIHIVNSAYNEKKYVEIFLHYRHLFC